MQRNSHLSLSLVGVFLFLTLLLVSIPRTVYAEFGTNWSATLFPSTDLTGHGVPFIGINGINFNWGTGSPVINGIPVPGIPSDNFSARFTSSQTFIAGTYQFIISSDDGVRIYIDGILVLDQFVGRVLTTDTFNYYLTSGTHILIVEYFEGIDQAIIQFQWLPVTLPVTPTSVPNMPPQLHYFTDSTMTLTWNTVSWVQGYQLRIDDDPNFGSALVVDVPAGTLSYTTPELPNGIYYWQVRAKRDAVNWGNWSAVQSFVVSAE